MTFGCNLSSLLKISKLQTAKAKERIVKNQKFGCFSKKLTKSFIKRMYKSNFLNRDIQGGNVKPMKCKEKS